MNGDPFLQLRTNCGSYARKRDSGAAAACLAVASKIRELGKLLAARQVAEPEVGAVDAVDQLGWFGVVHCPDGARKVEIAINYVMTATTAHEKQAAD